MRRTDEARESALNIYRFGEVALIGCQACETECRKRAEKDAQCKACASCAAACKKMAA